MAFEPSTLEQSIQNGSGTELYFWPPGLSVRRRKFPMLLTNITHNGITTPSLDTTHLGTEPPDDTNEFGGRTSIPGLLSDPGQLTLEGFLNASVILPKRIIVLQIVFLCRQGIPGRRGGSARASLRSAAPLVSRPIRI